MVISYLKPYNFLQKEKIDFGIELPNKSWHAIKPTNYHQLKGLEYFLKIE